MNKQSPEELKGKIWEIANRLRGPFRPPQYWLVMLRRLDFIREPKRETVPDEREFVPSLGCTQH